MNLSSLIEKAKAVVTVKVAEPWPNVANRIDDHLLKKYPSMFAVAQTYAGVWFTGSNVWPFLYGGTPPTGCDLDVVLTAEAPTEVLVAQLGVGLPLTAAQLRERIPCGRDLTAYGTGYRFIESPIGKVDLWRAPGVGTIQAALNNYPSASHAQCRTAYSPINGLVVLPNEAARD